jgi:phage tail sheath gpL-like
MSGASNGGALSLAPPQTITFNEIPYNIQVPGNYAEIKPNYSQAGLQSYPAKQLIVAQMRATGTGVANTVYPIYSAAQALALFGVGSIAADMATYFILGNPWTQLFMIGVEDAAGAVAATAAVTVAGTATDAGTLALYFGGQRMAVPVSAGDTLEIVSASVQATFDELINPVFFQTGGPSGLTAYSFNNKGTLGNGYDIRLNAQIGDVTPPGLTITITPFGNGATDPTIIAAVTAIGSDWYTDIAMCWNDENNVGVLEAALLATYNAMTAQGSHAYRAGVGTPGALQAAQAGFNSKFDSFIGIQNPMQPSWVWAAALAAQASFALANDPSRQLRSLVLTGIIAPAPADRFTDAERNILLMAGISTFITLSDGTVALERVVTENLTDANGVASTAWHDIMTPRTMTRIRYDWDIYVGLLYPRNKLSVDGSTAAEYDPTVVTPSRLKASWAGRSKVYARLGWLQNTSVTAQQSYFTIDSTDKNRVDCRLQVDIIGNLMILASSLEFQA